MSVFYREIGVRISDNKSELSRPLIIFERDRGLEIYFNLIDYAYKFDKKPLNSLKNLVGAYATVTLINPSGYEISRDNVEITEDAKVKFVITEDLADELTEIGTYQLQIHVNNDIKGRDTSVFSIPPFNFEVRERLKGKKSKLFDSEGNELTDKEGYQLMSATSNKVIIFSADQINEYLSSIPAIQREIESLTTNSLAIDKTNSYTNKLGYITPEMFGEIIDGADVTTILQNCIDYAIENNAKVVFTNNKVYCFTNLTIAKPCSIDFNNAILKSYNDDPNTSLLNIGLESDSFETKTLYSSKFNISNILVDLNNKQRKYGVEINCRHLRINRIVVRNAVNNGVYCGGNDGIWIDQILCFGDNRTSTSKGVIINCNNIILGNVECSYFKYGVYVQPTLNDIEISELRVWSDVGESSCIAYGGANFYGHINSLIIGGVKYGIDLNEVTDSGKLNIDNIMVFPSTNFTDWQVVREKFLRQSMGITIGAIYGINDADETLRFKNFNGIVKSLSNYNQRPKIYTKYSNMSESEHSFEQINGLLYQTSWAKVVITDTNSTDLGFTTGINKLWNGITVPVVIVGDDFTPISTNACMFISKDSGFNLRTSTNLNGTYYIKLGSGLPIGYFN